MKDYDAIVVWTDYFNRALSRSGGRRMGRDMCMHDPSVTDLSEAAKKAGLKVIDTAPDARYPRRPHLRSGYISLTKTTPKTKALRRIASKLVAQKKR